MGVADLRAQDSYNFPINRCNSESEQKSLALGHRRVIYLFFNFASCLAGHTLLKADLVLFKLPGAVFNMDKNLDSYNPANQYVLYPLLELFSASNSMFVPPAIDFSRGIRFEYPCCESYTKIDITQIVQDWNQSKLENNGLLLMSSNTAPYIFYASNEYKILGMRPFIRLKYENTPPNGLLRSVSCDVKIG